MHPRSSALATRPRPAAAAVLDATEALLRDRPFGELSVAEITAAAGVSRTTFYAHFTSRTAVIAESLRRVAAELELAVAPMWSAPVSDDTVRAGVQGWVTVASRHGALLRTVSEQWPHDPPLRARWLQLLDDVAGRTAESIRAARADGTAPPGADAAALAALLTWGCERTVHVALTGDALGLDSLEAIVEPLTQMVLGGAHGR